ncbi:sugar ABC transporter ATP-binding protein [Rhodococcus sp. NCIMB 12038]|jgi:ribose transport system ATP-binding protein|uniref:sugar ABC transporter ATP-binding protein n=1 Tax=Rhodococcus sp. NCIMB 12038 TaxID=933800 RepID=UPI000B3CA7E6|nr:sugar ABC transporter ATP-binding protein [Rhodococcus sp. NCIMB 12038]OUS88549.1 sugar ABC transporter [Rhodococcus sp. NCIMB 12038]
MSTANEARLVVEGVAKHYPGTIALDGVDLTINPGEVVALLGENGAGKSTLSSIIAGLTSPTTGTMRWRGQPYAPTSPGDAIAYGIGMIHQEMRLLPELTVAENVMVGRWPTRRGLISQSKMADEAAKYLHQLGFAGRMNQRVGDLSVAGQQQVEIAKALALEARLLILDEPTAALGQDETDALFETIRALRSQGVSFIYVSHRLAEIAQIADRIVVLRDGHKINEHSSGQVAPNELVREMVGRPVDRLFPDINPPANRVLLSVQGLTSGAGKFADITFDVHAGEIFGIAGIVGAGRTEVVRAIAGADSYASGTVTIDGVPMRGSGLGEAISTGIVLVPEDRKQQGLIVSETIEDNIALPNLDSLQRKGWVSPGAVRALSSDVAKRLGIKGRPESPVASLSGGNQQKVVLGKWLERKPRVVILDEPTRGIDVGARSAIYSLIADLTAAGTAVIVVSSDLDEVLGLAHRVMVLARGRSQGILQGQAMTAHGVMELATA